MAVGTSSFVTPVLTELVLRFVESQGARVRTNEIQQHLRSKLCVGSDGPVAGISPDFKPNREKQVREVLHDLAKDHYLIYYNRGRSGDWILTIKGGNQVCPERRAG